MSTVQKPFRKYLCKSFKRYS